MQLLYSWQIFLKSLWCTLESWKSWTGSRIGDLFCGWPDWRTRSCSAPLPLQVNTLRNINKWQVSVRIVSGLIHLRRPYWQRSQLLFGVWVWGRVRLLGIPGYYSLVVLPTQVSLLSIKMKKLSTRLVGLSGKASLSKKDDCAQILSQESWAKSGLVWFNMDVVPPT